jgi:hypothetical protein
MCDTFLKCNRCRYWHILGRQEEFVISYDHKRDLVLLKVYKMDRSLVLWQCIIFLIIVISNNQFVIGVVQVPILFAHGCSVLLF